MKIINLVKNKIYIVIALASIIGIILISISFYKVFKEEGIKNKQLHNSLSNINSYYSKYNVKIIENKASYIVEEWYKIEGENEFFKFKFKDFMGNMTSIVINPNGTYLENDYQIAKFVKAMPTVKKENMYSLSTYLDIIKKSTFRIENTLTEVTNTYTMYLNEPNNSEVTEKLQENAFEIDKVELYVIANLPKNISLYSKEKEIIKIEILEFKYNEEILNEEFGGYNGN